MTKLTLDMTSLKSEVTRIHQEAFAAVNASNDNQRRDALLKVTEMLKALKSSLDAGNVKVEVK